MPDINLNEINWLAIIVAAVVAFFIGGVWYSALFAKAWVRAQGWTDEQVAAIKAKTSPPKFFGGMILSYVVAAFGLALLASAADVSNATHGLCLGAVVWLVASAITFTHLLASGKVITAWLIDIGCEFFYMLAMGAIIGAWPAPGIAVPGIPAAS